MYLTYTCARCATIYDPKAQGSCPSCRHHPHLEDECDHDCDRCASVLFPPKDGYLDRFHPSAAQQWRRVSPQIALIDAVKAWREAKCLFEGATPPRRESVPGCCLGDNHLEECPVERARQDFLAAHNKVEQLYAG